MKTLNVTLIAVFAAILAVPAAHAQTLVVVDLANPDYSVLQPATGGPNGPEPRTYETTGDLGYIFQVGSSNLLLTNLGVYAPSTGLQGSTVVDVYATSGNSLNIATAPLVASATVAAGTTPDSQGFAYATAAPTLLLAGQQYAIFFTDSSKDEFFDALFNSGGSAAQLSSLYDTTDITPLSTVLNASTANYDYYVSPNAEFIVGGTLPTTPEPSSVALLMAGGIAVGGFLRLRKKS